MHISKHNYAIELEKQGNLVYFMNPPNQDKQVKDYQVNKVDGYDSLFVIDSYLPNNKLIDYVRLRLKFTQFYDQYLFKLVKRICKKENIQLEQVWSFDPNLHGFLYKYPAKNKIFFIADAVQNNSQIRAAKNVDLVVSVAEDILEPFRKINSQCLLINHGLNREYEKYAVKKLNELRQQGETAGSKSNAPINVGYIGNLLIPFLYEDGLKKVVTENPGINFHFWGAHSSNSNNLLAVYDDKILNTIDYLKTNCKNAFFYGVKTSAQIIEDLDKIDLFIYINSSEKDINGGANSHKILEYLSTGKVVVSTWLSFYEEQKLFPMTVRSGEKEFSNLFSKTICQLSFYNSVEMQKKRIEYSLKCTYDKNILKIQNSLN
ncbi:MAG: hypothetical protein JNM14_12470 [Ferruginibacter sp.]|nr:hypothetical protein [Ferruginibacter sp.]